MVTGTPADPGSSALYAADEHGQMAGPYIYPDELRIGLVRYEELRPGRYLLTLDGRARRIVEVTPADVDLRLRFELGAPGVVRGTVSLEDVPPDLRPDVVRISFSSSWLARWTEPAAGRLLTQGPGIPVMSAELRWAIDPRFRLEDADPHQPFELSAWGGRGVTGNATVHVPPGGTADVIIRMRVVGGVRLLFEPPCPVPEIRIRFRRDGGDWGDTLTFDDLEGHTELSGRISLRAGRYRWEATWNDPDGTARTRDGEVVVPPGRRTDVVVPFGTRRE